MDLKNTTLFIWDMDGTLLNSHPATFYAFNEALHPFLKKKFTFPEISKYYGPREDVILEKILRIEGGYKEGEELKEKTKECFEIYLKEFKSALNQVHLFDGIAEVLNSLQQKGHKLAIFTGRGREGTDLLVEHFKLSPFFSLIVTNSEIQSRKPHPEGIFHICKKMETKHQHAVMIGDSTSDVLAAKRAGVLSVGCVWDSLADREKVEGEKPTYLLGKARELLGLV